MCSPLLLHDVRLLHYQFIQDTFLYVNLPFNGTKHRLLICVHQKYYGPSWCH